MCRYDFRLSDSETGRLTPALFHALLERKRAGEKQEFLRAGIVAAAVINFSMGHPDKPVTEADFVPDWLREDKDKQAVDLTTLTAEQQAAYVINQFSKRTYRRK